MKKIFLTSIAALLAITATAQDFDTKPNLTIDKDEQDLHFTVGARFMADGAVYHSDFTPLQSGGTISDARIRTGISMPTLASVVVSSAKKTYSWSITKRLKRAILTL